MPKDDGVPDLEEVSLEEGRDLVPEWGPAPGPTRPPLGGWPAPKQRDKCLTSFERDPRGRPPLEESKDGIRVKYRGNMVHDGRNLGGRTRGTAIQICFDCPGGQGQVIQFKHRMFTVGGIPVRPAYDLRGKKIPATMVPGRPAWALDPHPNGDNPPFADFDDNSCGDPEKGEFCFLDMPTMDGETGPPLLEDIPPYMQEMRPRASVFEASTTLFCNGNIVGRVRWKITKEVGEEPEWEVEILPPP